MDNRTVAEDTPPNQSYEVVVDVPTAGGEGEEQEAIDWKKPFFIGLAGIILLLVGWVWTKQQATFVSKLYFQPIALAILTGLCPVVFLALATPPIAYRWLGREKPDKIPWKEIAINAAILVPLYWLSLALLQISLLRIGWRETTLFLTLAAPIMVLLGIAGKMGGGGGKREVFTLIGSLGIAAVLPVALYFVPSRRLWTTNLVTLIGLAACLSVYTLALRYWSSERKQLNPFAVLGMHGAFTAGLGVILWLLTKLFRWTWLAWPTGSLQMRIFTYTATVGFLFIAGYFWTALLTSELVAACAIGVALPVVALVNCFVFGRAWADYQWLMLAIPTAALVLALLGIRKEHQRGLY